MLCLACFMLYAYILSVALILMHLVCIWHVKINLNKFLINILRYFDQLQCVMLSIPKTSEKKKKKKKLLREFISDVVMSRGNWRFLLTNLQAQIWGCYKSLLSRMQR